MRLLRRSASLAVLGVVLAAVVAVAACTSNDQASSTTEPDAGGAADAASEAASLCCPPDPHPACCMDYGGRRHGQCGQDCDGMPAPEDPRWTLVTDSDGCLRWSNPADYFHDGKETPGTAYCGGVHRPL